MKALFQIGDVVQSLCDGPEMSVQEIKDNGEILCDWFDNDGLLQKTAVTEAELVYRPNEVQIFSINDCVVTNVKGSPKLIVVAVNDPMVECVWTDKNQKEHSGTFRKEELDKRSIYDGSETFLNSSNMPYK